VAIRERSEEEELVEGFRRIVGFGPSEEWERSFLVRQLLKLLPVDMGVERTAWLLGIGPDDVVRYVAIANSGPTGA
jgi:hypothetical protein